MALAVTAACGVGGDGGSGGENNGGIDDRTKLGIVCSASFKVTGTFAPGTPGRPTDPDTGGPLTGCWPVGTWTFTAALDTNECPKAPAVLSGYSFRVDRVEGSDGQGLVDQYTNTTSVGSMTWHLGVTSTGKGCEAHLELGSPDGKEYWQMKPSLLNTATTTLVGSGDYDLYNADGWPWK